MARLCSAIIVATLLGAVATAGAQAPASGKPQTVSGCLHRTDAGTYVLALANVAALPGNGPGGAVGTSGSGTKTLPVIGMIPPSVSLRQFVDQKVEVTAIVKDSPTQPGTPAIEIVDATSLPANTQPVKAQGGSCK
jgi:hypothetical protein